MNAADTNPKLPAEWWRRVRHDLRNAIAPMRMATQLLRSGRADEDERDEALKVIDRQLEHLLETIEDVGDLLRVQAGALALRAEPQDANLLLDLVCGRAALVRELAARKLQLHYEACQQELRVAHDPARVAALLEFLLLRMAAHASPGADLKLSLHPDHDGVLRLSGANPSLAQDAELLYLQGIDGGQGEPGLRTMLLRQLLQATGMKLRLNGEGGAVLHFPSSA